MKTQEELISILSNYNFWNKDIDVGLPRGSYVNQILSVLIDINIVTETGIRRSGKSYIARQVVKQWISLHNKFDTLIINLDDERFIDANYNLLLDIYNAYSNLVKKSDNILIVLDEAQEIEGWERFVRGLSEKGVKFLITGSSSKLLSSEFSTLLSGRSININIMPLSFTEFLLFNNIKITERNAIPFNMEKIAKLLEEYIKYGGMPAAVLHKDIKEDLIISYFDTIIVRDIIERYHISNEHNLRYLIMYYLTNISSTITYNRISSSTKNNNISIPVKSVQRYSNYIESTNLISFLDMFSYSLKEKENNPRKVFSIDNSFPYIIGFNFSENKGHFIENIVFQELFRNKCPFHYDLYYYKNGYETDFVIKLKAYIIPFQVTYKLNEGNIQREIKGITNFCKKFNLNSGVIINYNVEKVETVDGIQIQYVKLLDFLLNSNNYLLDIFHDK